MSFGAWASHLVFVCPTCWVTWITLVTHCLLRNPKSLWVRQNMFVHLEETEKPWQIIALPWSSLIHEGHYYLWLLHTRSGLVEWQPLVSGQAGLEACLKESCCLELGRSFLKLSCITSAAIQLHFFHNPKTRWNLWVGFTHAGTDQRCAPEEKNGPLYDFCS